MGESLHKLADLTDAAEFEGFQDPAKNAADKQSAPKHEPYLRHRLRRHVQIWQSFVTLSGRHTSLLYKVGIHIEL
jgi:hypothetical protein